MDKMSDFYKRQSTNKQREEVFKQINACDQLLGAEDIDMMGHVNSIYGHLSAIKYTPEFDKKGGSVVCSSAVTLFPKLSGKLNDEICLAIKKYKDALEKAQTELYKKETDEECNG